MMKNFKKIIVLLMAVAVTFSIACGSLSAAAEEYDYGTFDGGMIPGKAIPYYGTLTDGKGFPNNDFEQGLKYWGHLHGKINPTTIAKIVKESDGNHCLQFAAEKEWDGLYSVCFTDSRLKVGDSPSLLFRYSGNADIQIILMQECKNLKNNVRAEVRLAFRLKTIIKADSDDGWNIAVLEPNKAVVAPTDEGKQYDDSNIYLNYFVQITSDPTCNTKIDDLQIVTYDTTAGTIKDLDGKLLYDLNALNPPEDDDTSGDNGSDGDNTTGGSAGTGDATDSLNSYTPEELIVMDGDYPTDDEKSDGKISSKDDGGNSSKNYIWIIVAAGVVVILGAGVGVFFVIKSKKKTTPPDDNTEETPTPNEENIDE